ncbi:MAG: mechanosensitive ion channel domain-containing protein [Candidatus Bathyarchaeota archaeon]
MYEALIELLSANAWKFIYSITILIVLLIAYKALMRLINRKAENLALDPHVKNILRLMLRIIFITVTITMIFQTFNLPTNVFVGGSALIGAAIGFGSSQTINNITAGFYVLISQPFKVKDYVKIGDVEGQVEEISINYTSLYTPTFNLLKVPNTQVMSSKVLNMTHEGYIKYTYRINFDHVISEERFFTEVLNPAMQEFTNLWSGEGLRSPEAYLDAVDRLGKTYLIRLFIAKGEAKMLYTLQPELTKLIMKHYDALRNPDT